MPIDHFTDLNFYPLTVDGAIAGTVTGFLHCVILSRVCDDESDSRGEKKDNGGINNMS